MNLKLQEFFIKFLLLEILGCTIMFSEDLYKAAMFGSVTPLNLLVKNNPPSPVIFVPLFPYILLPVRSTSAIV